MRGIPLYVGSSWAVIAVLFVFLQYSNLTESERVTGLEALLLSAFITVLFFGSVLLHPKRQLKRFDARLQSRIAGVGAQMFGVQPP